MHVDYILCPEELRNSLDDEGGNGTVWQTDIWFHHERAIVDRVALIEKSRTRKMRL